METAEKKQYLFDNKALAALIFPLIVEQFLAVLVGMADSVMIASVGEEAVSGVSLVDNIMVLFINLFAALATGGAVVAGQYLGYKNEKASGHAATQLIRFILVMSLAVTVFIYLGKGLILDYVFGAITPEVRRNADIYLMIVTASIPFIALYNGGAAIFRAMGNSEVSMKVALVMNAVNVCGNALLIYGFHRGTEGVAIPTLVSRIVAAVLILFLLARSKGAIRIERAFSLRFDGSMVVRILRIGVPNGMENGMFQLGKILVLSLVSSFGTSAIAANAVGNAVALFQMLPAMAINLAITTVVAQCIGAGDYRQAQYYTKKLMLLSYASLMLINIVIFLAVPLILKVYNLTPQTASTARDIMYLHGICCTLFWPPAFCLPTTLRAAGDAQVTMWISIVSMWLCRIVCSYILGRYLGMGVFGVWIAMILDWCFRIVAMGIRYRQGKWKTMKAI